MLFLPALDNGSDFEPETVQETMMRVSVAIQQFADALAETLVPIFEHITETWEVIQRAVFIGWLIQHHVPPTAAHWIGEHWPLHWIPPADKMYRELASGD